MPPRDPTAPPPVHGIVFHRDYLALEEHGKTVKAVRRGQFESITLEHGFYSHHPLLQTIFGLGLTVVGALPAVWALRWAREGGTLDVWYFVVVLLLPLGLWVVRDATRRGLQLVVRGTPESHKLPLPRTAEPPALYRQVQAAAGAAGYEVGIGPSAADLVGDEPAD